MFYNFCLSVRKVCLSLSLENGTFQAYTHEVLVYMYMLKNIDEYISHPNYQLCPNFHLFRYKSRKHTCSSFQMKIIRILEKN